MARRRLSSSVRSVPPPSRPAGPESPQRPSSLHHAMIHPLLPFALRGVLWYQGESNAPRARE